VDDFQFENPEEMRQQRDFNSGWYGGADAAWILQLIKLKLDNTSLPQEIKDNLIVDMVPYIECASMTKIQRGQVREFIGGFRELWTRYRVFKVRKKYVPELNYVMAYIRELLILNLNKSIDGWQGDHVFERKTSYNVSQTHKDLTERIQGFLGGRKQKKKIVTEESE
jgi:hypothetical protein